MNWPVECSVCLGAGVNAHGHDCRPCRAAGWVVRACQCGQCDNGTETRLVPATDGWDEVGAMCAAGSERAASPDESILAHQRFIELARARGQDELTAVLARFDALMAELAPA